MGDLSRAAASAVPAVELADVGFSYGDGAGAALSHVDLVIPAGQHVCVLGANGSGKSTLVRLMNALETPGSGTARVLGSDVSDPEGALRARRRAAMVFQHPDDQMVTSVVEDDVAFGPENLGVPRPEIERRVRRALDAVGMADHASADPADLSGGQRQRVAIAGALAMEPDLLLLDEPAAMLDVEGRRAIQRIVAELAGRGITIVHVTHFMDDALGADRVVVLDRGRVALDGTPGEVFAEPSRLRALGLDLPFALELADRLAGAGGTFADLPRTADAGVLAREVARAMGSRVGAPRHTGGDPGATGAPRDATAADGGRAAVSFDGVSFSYADARDPRRREGLLARWRRSRPRAVPLALDGASLTVGEGSVTALVGPTGSGKSTTVELACALKLPRSGAVEVLGIDTADLARRRELRGGVGYVAQLPERQLFAETVLEDVSFGPRHLGLAEDEVRERVASSLSLLGVDPAPGLLARSPFSLSGGQQRAVAIAGVLAMRPRVLILDEPMAGLDPRGRSRMRRLIRDLGRAGETIIMVSHSMDDVAELADHVVALRGGRVAAEGSPAEVFRGGADGLPGIPEALGFARLLAREGAPVGEPLTLDGLIEEVLHGAAR